MRGKGIHVPQNHRDIGLVEFVLQPSDLLLKSRYSEFRSGFVHAGLNTVQASDNWRQRHNATSAADDMLVTAVGAREALNIICNLELAAAGWATECDEVRHVDCPLSRREFSANTWPYYCMTIGVEDIAPFHPDALADSRERPAERVGVGGAYGDRISLRDRPYADWLDDEVAQLFTLVGRSQQVGKFRVQPQQQV